MNLEKLMETIGAQHQIILSVSDLIMRNLLNTDEFVELVKDYERDMEEGNKTLNLWLWKGGEVREMVEERVGGLEGKEVKLMMQYDDIEEKLQAGNLNKEEMEDAARKQLFISERLALIEKETSFYQSLQE